MSDKYAELRNHIWGKRRIIRDLLDERDALVEALTAFVDEFSYETGTSSPYYHEVEKARSLIEAAKRQEDT